MACNFFKRVDESWKSYGDLRSKYEDHVPAPNNNYITRFSAISDIAQTTVNIISNPLWLALNTIGYLLKALINLAATLMLITPTALMAITGSSNTKLNESFFYVATNTLVATAMAGYALMTTLFSVFLSPICFLSRAVSTGLGLINDLTNDQYGTMHFPCIKG